jgi:endoglucanase
MIALLSVPAASGCSALFPSSDKPPPPITEVWQTHPVRADSVGYVATRAKKVTIVLPSGMTTLANAAADVRDASTDAVVWSCTVTGPMTDSATMSTYYIGDFTPVETPGRYYIAVPGLTTSSGIAKSAAFNIAPDAFRELMTDSMVAFYGQRCGTAVTVNLHSTKWSHGACHANDASQKYLDNVMMDTIKPSLHGWHDAGDYGKYVTNGAFTVGMLLEAFERFQPLLSTLSLPIPEHGGTIPDFLAEVKWELDWLLTTMQDDGSVSFKVTALQFEGFVMPEQDGSRRYYTGISTSATGNFAAVMAQAARVYMPYDATLAGQYLAAAELAYTFLKGHGRTSPDLSMFGTGGYDANSGDSDNRLWAAAELWETTGDAQYLADFEGSAVAKTVADNFDYDNVTNLAIFTYLMSTKAGRDQTQVDAMKASAIASANALAARADAAAFGRAINGYWWGSNGAVARAAMNLWVGGLLSPDDAPHFSDAIAMQLDHLLGRNIYDRTQVTGMGYHPPTSPHHRPSIADDANNPWPGLLVGGSQPDAVSWKDSSDDASLNEVAINWNAPLVYAAAALTPAP